jgi:hypothetical protein
LFCSLWLRTLQTLFRQVFGRNPATPLALGLFERRILTLKSDKSIFEPDNMHKKLDSGPEAPPE